MTCSPDLKSGEHVKELRERLQVQDWVGADQETRRLLAPDSVSLPPFDQSVVSPEQIRAIDQLWLTASQGRFGLSVQLRLWQAARANHPTHPELAVDAFRDRVGWTITAPRSEVDFIRKMGLKPRRFGAALYCKI